MVYRWMVTNHPLIPGRPSKTEVVTFHVVTACADAPRALRKSHQVSLSSPRQMDSYYFNRVRPVSLSSTESVSCPRIWRGLHSLHKVFTRVFYMFYGCVMTVMTVTTYIRGGMVYRWMVTNHPSIPGRPSKKEVVTRHSLHTPCAHSASVRKVSLYFRRGSSSFFKFNSVLAPATNMCGKTSIV